MELNRPDPRDLYDDTNDNDINLNIQDIQNIEDFQEQEFGSRNERQLYFAELPEVQSVITEFIAFISPNIQHFNDAALQMPKNTGLEWAAKFGGRIEGGKRLIRAASVLSRIKREIIKISNRQSQKIDNHSKQKMSTLCDRFNQFFSHPGLQALNPDNANSICTIATFALARMAVAIDPQSAHILQ
ncbi:MAG: hypothetical protein EZS28_053605, partial [Streblomastix strix]